MTGDLRIRYRALFGKSEVFDEVLFWRKNNRLLCCGTEVDIKAFANKSSRLLGTQVVIKLVVALHCSARDPVVKP